MARIEEIACMDRLGVVTWMEDEAGGGYAEKGRGAVIPLQHSLPFFFNLKKFLCNSNEKPRQQQATTNRQPENPQNSSEELKNFKSIRFRFP